MARFQLVKARSSALVLTVAVAAACSDSVGLDGAGSVQITIQQSAAETIAAVLASTSSSVAGASSGSIDVGNVESLVVEVASIQFLPVLPDAATEDDAEWVSLDLADPVEIDLMMLPTEGESPLVIAAGSVEPGDYRAVRLIVSSAAIVFVEAFSVGQAMFEGTYPVTVPSGAQTGLKTDIGFSVGEGASADVNLLFDPDATFRNATATGSGSVILSPVLRG